MKLNISNEIIHCIFKNNFNNSLQDNNCLLLLLFPMNYDKIKYDYINLHFAFYSTIKTILVLSSLSISLAKNIFNITLFERKRKYLFINVKPTYVTRSLRK